MPRGVRTSMKRAAEAKALSELGHARGEISKLTGVGARTVSDIIAGRNGWAGIMENDPRFNACRMESKRALQVGSVELAKKALEQIEKKLPQASAAQAGVIYGIMRDKERLDAGEPTQHIAHIHHYEDIDSILKKIQGALLSKQRTKAP